MKKKPVTLHLIRYTLLILAWSGYMSPVSLAQSPVLEKRLSVNFTDSPLQLVLDELTHTHTISFSYFKNQLPLQKKLTLSVTDQPLHVFLDKLCLQAGIRYQAIGGQIVLKALSTMQPRDASDDKPVGTGNVAAAPPAYKSLFASNYLIPGAGRRPEKKPSRAPGDKSDWPLYGKVAAETSRTPPRTLPGAVGLSAAYVMRTGSVSPLTNPYSLDELPATTSVTLALPVPLPPLTKPVFTHSGFQMALLPGISTHGIHPGEYTNAVSLNLLAGYSAGNQVVEIGGLSNFNQQNVRGLQIGGLANVVGGNKFTGLSSQEKQKLLQDKTMESNLAGIQLAGITNVIDGNVFGWQTAGGVNLVKKSMQGLQVAGLSNVVSTYVFGMQLAGLSNAAMESVDGVQVAALYNYTAGELHGIQLGAFNQAGNIEGQRSLIASGHTGLQLGLLNTAQRMNGFQLGLINIGGNMAGTQVGLINIHRNKKGTGVPVGLLNITSTGQFVRLYASELFVSNLEVSTGSLRVQNMLSIGYNPVLLRPGQPLWSAGYSIGQIKKPGKDWFYSYDAGVAHLHFGGTLARQLSLLTRARATAGYKIQLRKLDFHLFGGLTFNTFVSDTDRLPVSPGLLRMYYENGRRTNVEAWPGFVAGIHLH